MSGIDFVDTIVVRSTEKGTKIVNEPLNKMKWAGKSFKEDQAKKLSKLKGLRLESAKGTSKIELAKLYQTSIPEVDGMYISTNKGTGLFQL